MSKKNLNDAVLDTLERLADVSQKNTDAVKGILQLLKSQARRIAALEAKAKEPKKKAKKKTPEIDPRLLESPAERRARKDQERIGDQIHNAARRDKDRF